MISQCFTMNITYSLTHSTLIMGGEGYIYSLTKNLYPTQKIIIYDNSLYIPSKAETLSFYIFFWFIDIDQADDCIPTVDIGTSVFYFYLLLELYFFFNITPFQKFHILYHKWTCLKFF